MGLNPSNLMVKGIKFPNYAGFGATTNIDLLLRAELKAASIQTKDWPEYMRENSGEVKSIVRGEIDNTFWHFQRAWYYWIAKGPGIPLTLALPFHKKHGGVVRVNGNAGAPSPETFNGFGIGHYHIDTSEGLKAFASLLKQILEGV